MAKQSPKSPLDNHANQLNDTHPLYYRSRGFTQEDAEKAAREARAKSHSAPSSDEKPTEIQQKDRKAG